MRASRMASASLFRPRHNTLARLSLLVIGGGAVATLLGVMGYVRSPLARGMQDPVEQPIQFDHRHHTRDEGIDCMFCHTTVDRSPHAGIPDSQLCMNCHSQIWNQSPYLEPVRASFRDDRPLNWIRVNDLPDFVYFNHSIHVRKGVGCETCHGRVDRMPLMFQAKSLQMEWCLDCHRDPSRYVRPLDEITTMGYVRPASVNGTELVRDYKIAGVAELTSCSVCHR
jgi:hypothetical protein